MRKTFSIEARSYDLRGIASHNFWILRDNNDDVISQLHGLATDRKTKTYKPIGYFNDQLGFYEFKIARNDPSFIFEQQRSAIIFQGDKDEVLRRWNKAALQIKSLNSRDLNYSPFGVFGFPITNSNSAYHLFANLMDIPCYHFSGVLEPGIKNELKFCQFDEGVGFSSRV